jgi:hypothetical protein
VNDAAEMSQLERAEWLQREYERKIAEGSHVWRSRTRRSFGIAHNVWSQLGPSLRRCFTCSGDGTRARSIAPCELVSYHVDYV